MQIKLLQYIYSICNYSRQGLRYITLVCWSSRECSCKSNGYLPDSRLLSRGGSMSDESIWKVSLAEPKCTKVGGPHTFSPFSYQKWQKSGMDGPWQITSRGKSVLQTSGDSLRLTFKRSMRFRASSIRFSFSSSLASIWNAHNCV